MDAQGKAEGKEEAEFRSQSSTERSRDLKKPEDRAGIQERRIQAAETILS